MALHRGIQSAIFFYLSCAPCAEMRVRKRRRQEAERDRATRAELVATMPGLYHHPEPSSTNPHWQTEIEAGPIPARTRKRMADHVRTARASSTRSNGASSVSVDASFSMERSDSALSGIGPYQRHDEVLWGSTTSDIARTRHGRMSSSRDTLPARLPRAVLNDARQSRTYLHPQHPAINDLHPPTTRKVQSKEEVMWMLQPPPVAEIMSGRTASQPSRTTSGASRPSKSLRSKNVSRSSSQTSPGLSPDMPPIERLTGAAPQLLQVPVRLTRSRTLPVRHHRSELTQAGAHKPIRKPPPPLQLSQTNHNVRSTTARPHLSTILSEGAVPYSLDYENNTPPRSASLDARADVATRDSTGKDNVVELRSEPTMLSKRRSTQSPSLVETRLLVSPTDAPDEYAAEPVESLECWTNPDFELPQWIHEHTRREVRERWSF